ncbi:MAG: DUF4231 domain-containing protein [Marmoricola sp.]
MTTARGGMVDITEPDYPTAHTRADEFSLAGQRRTVWGASARLQISVAATALLALAPLWPSHVGHREVEFVGLAAAAFFLAAFAIELRRVKVRPERDWYDGRAVAESTKTLVWRYVAGGQPYPIGADADEAFRRDVENLGTDVPALRRAVADGNAPTAWMVDVRSLPFDARRDVYLQDRVTDQETWYADKAAYNHSRTRIWTGVLLLAEAAGVVLALIRSLTIIDIDLAPIAAAVIASGVAWMALRQHESVGAAYSLASKELGSVRTKLSAVTREEEWATAVAEAEEAISREHTMWRVARSES